MPCRITTDRRFFTTAPRDPQEQRRFERRYGRPLRVPETWSEFVDVATFFTRPHDGLYGVVVAGLNDGHNTVYDFFIHLWSRGGRLFDEHWRPAFHGEEGREALQFYVDMVTTMGITPPRTLEYDSVAAGMAYAAGEGAMMLNWSGFMAVAQLPPSVIIGEYLDDPIPLRDVHILLRITAPVVRAYTAADGIDLPLRVSDDGWEVAIPQITHGAIAVFEIE